jgi:hypothetical protein
MTNTERIVSALRDEPGLSDSELRRITRIEPHQQVNQICRRLASQGIVRRQRGAGCLVPLIYAGQAGATSRRTKTESRATLRSRIGGNHLRGNIRSSNFRKTISALLLQPLGLQLAGLNKLDPASNRIVSEWIRRHLGGPAFSGQLVSGLFALLAGLQVFVTDLSWSPVPESRVETTSIIAKLDV